MENKTAKKTLFLSVTCNASKMDTSMALKSPYGDLISTTQQITWHGETYFCDETLQLTVNPASGYVVHVYRHLVLSAHLSEFLKLYYPSAMHSRMITNYLKINDPIGEAAELTYNTTTDSMNTHLAAVRDINNLMTYVPLWVCIPILLIGAALTWRFFGRSYYWKRYREYEQVTGSSQTKTKRKSSRKKTLAIGMCSILLVSSIGYVVYQNMNTTETRHADTTGNDRFTHLWGGRRTNTTRNKPGY